MGIWVNLAAVGSATRTVFSLSDTATTNNHLTLQMASSEQLQLAAAGGGTTNTVTATGVVLVAGQWSFALARFISSDNRRLSVLSGSGVVTAVSISTARTPTGLDTMTIGARLSSAGVNAPWSGHLGEWWIADADAAIDSAADMPADMMWQLAYGGPFSVPYLVPRIVEYRSLRAHPTVDDPTETYNRGAPATWTAVNGPTIGQHPPLPYWYRNSPGNTSSILMV